MSQPSDTLPIAKHLRQPQASYRSERSGPQGTFRGFKGANPPIPGIRPGVGEHAPSPRTGGGGGGPGAEHRLAGGRSVGVACWGG